MSSPAYELGKSAALEKDAFLGQVASWAGKGLANLGRSLIPRVGRRAANVVTRPGARTFGEGLRSVGSGIAHGLSGGRLMPRGTPARIPFQYARGLADVVYRNPYAIGIAGDVTGLLPENVTNAIYATAGLGSKAKGFGGLLNKGFGAYSAYELGKNVLGGAPQAAQQVAQQADPRYHDMAAGLMAGREAMQNMPRQMPNHWGRVYGGARQAGRVASGLMPGQVGSAF